MKKIFLSLFSVIVLSSFVSCDEHEPIVEETIQPGYVILENGLPIHPDKYDPSHDKAVGVVFYANNGKDDKFTSGQAFAVSLNDIRPQALTDTIPTTVGTSTSTEDYEGMTNTYLLYQKGSCGPASLLTTYWGQANLRSYIPSIAQLRRLQAAKSVINPIIEKCGGEPFDDSNDNWYWSSTEVEGSAQDFVWVMNLTSGLPQMSLKTESQRCRAVITIY